MTSIAKEAWIWFGFVMAAIILRLISRRLVLGSWKNLQIDDYLMIFAIAPYTTMIVCLIIVNNIFAKYPTIDTDFGLIDPIHYPEIAKASKLSVVSDMTANTTTWIMKACMLILYTRLTQNLKQQKFVFAIAAYVALSYVVLEGMFLGYWCRPFSDYWSMDPGSVQCITYKNHCILNAVVNLSSDVILFAIMLPVVIRIQLPLAKKLIVYAVFGFALFTITATALNRAFNISNPVGSQWPLWFIREPSTAVITANLPFLLPVLQSLMHLRSTLSSLSFPFVGRSSKATGDNGSDTSVSKSDVTRSHPKDLETGSTQNIVAARTDDHRDISKVSEEGYYGEKEIARLDSPQRPK